MKAILILSDSLNRHYLPCYGNPWVIAPNIERLARQSVTFDNHWIGSAPCMPARRDMITGRLNFLERDWGGLEPFDVPFPALLRDRANIFCHMETDHYHYWHVGGENYHMPFNTWSLHRGQEADTMISRIQTPPEPPHLGQWRAQYAKNQTAFKTAADFSTPQTFQGAINWLQANQRQDDFFLWVEVFDPHEPFDCPPEYLALYGDDWDGPLYNWSGYDHVDGSSPAARHLQRQYAATLTMMDEWLGKLLDELERQNILDETLIILTTDHGHLLSERNLTGKNNWHTWNELAHIPLFVHLPGGQNAGERRTALTQNIDLMPTLLDYFGAPISHPIHGESWRNILEHNAPAQRQAALYGWFGQTVNLTDGRYTYFRAPAHPDNQPLYRHFLTPGTFSFRDICSPDFYDGAELDHWLPYTPYPVIRARASRPRRADWADTMLYCIETDYGQTTNLAGSEIEAHYARLLIEIMQKMDAPPSQFERLGLPL